MTKSPLLIVAGLAAATLVPACAKKDAPTAPLTDAGAAAPAKDYGMIPRQEFNRLAVQANLPLYWSADPDKDGAVDADEIVALRFYPTEGAWVEGGQLTKAFDEAYARLVDLQRGAQQRDQRQALVIQDLDSGRPTLVWNDLRQLPPDHQAFAKHMLTVATQIDGLFEHMAGNDALAKQVPEGDAASASLFRRNRGPRCAAPTTEKNPACSAIPGNPKPIVDVYPAALQQDPKFCMALEARPDAADLLGPFTAVRDNGGKLVAVPYSEAYGEPMKAIAAELRAAADALTDPNEEPLRAYLRAAAGAFETNDWLPVDEAWAKMNAESSRWYVRVAPDETYWEPCAHKAGFHLSFALINKASLDWQKKLAPVLQDMEKAVAERAGKPYKEREVSFHLPDFIDIVVNAGDDRGPFGATIGQSLPNWGPVADGRGRTVAMSNLYTDPDSMAARRAQAASLLDAASLARYVDDPLPGLLTTILHEACHNLGPAHEYKVKGKVDDVLFGGQLAAMLEELKAQVGGMYLVELLRSRKIIDDELAQRSYADAIVWAFGHISQGMYSAEGDRKPYSQLSAIMIGYLMDRGALKWDPNAPAANGKDVGAFTIVWDQVVPAFDLMIRDAAGIKARGDKKAAEALAARYVDGKTVPLEIIAERYLREPKASFVYAVGL